MPASARVWVGLRRSDGSCDELENERRRFAAYPEDSPMRAIKNARMDGLGFVIGLLDDWVSTPERRYIGAPERDCITDDGSRADPAHHRGRRVCLLHHVVPGRDRRRYTGGRRRAALGDRGQLRDRQERAWLRPQRNPLLAWLAPPRLIGDARLRHAGDHPPPCEPLGTPKNDAADSAEPPGLIRWSMQEIRRVATRLAQRRIQPAHIITWSLWRRAHQAAAQHSH